MKIAKRKTREKDPSPQEWREREWFWTYWLKETGEFMFMETTTRDGEFKSTDRCNVILSWRYRV